MGAKSTKRLLTLFDELVLHNMKKLTIIILTVGILSSCSSVKNSIAKNPIQEIKTQNIYKLNGIYKNVSLEPNTKFTSLWSILNHKIEEVQNFEKLKVKINIDKNDNRLINISLLDNDEVIDSKILKGKVDKGYYLLKNQIKLKMLVFIIVWGIGNSSVKIGLSEKNELVVLSKTEGVGLILFFPGFASGGGLREYRFERIE